MSKLLDRFLSYVQFDTQSNPGFDTVPSTSKQFELAKFLKAELETLGLADVRLDDNCYLMARLPSNTDQTVTPIGFVAHMDTAFDYSGENVNPLIRPIRVGTDGARLSFKGLPCPNVFTGGYNFHGPYEFIALEDMEKEVAQ